MPACIWPRGVRIITGLVKAVGKEIKEPAVELAATVLGPGSQTA